MRRHAITIRIGDHDRTRVRIGRDIDVSTVVPFFNDTLPASARVNHDYIVRELKRRNLRPPELAVDLLVVAVAVFAADLRIGRSDDSQDGWTREIDLHIPVSDPQVWASQSALITNILNFLTGDLWRLNFRARPRRAKILAPKLPDGAHPSERETVCLFSGGLDSFIGAVDLIESDSRPILVGHHKSADVAVFQSRCFEVLQKAYKDRAPEFASIYLAVPKETFDGAEEKSERGRSFLFLSLGVLFASALGGESRLVVPENGLISLNVPLTPLRLGALSTKTTHPYFMAKLQELVSGLGLRVRLSNPYQCKTKGEMVRECKNPELLRCGVTATMSCAHPTARRWDGQPTQHCGTCVPCLIRQAALRAGLGRDPTPYTTRIRSRPLDATKSEGEQVRAFQVALARLRAKPGIERLLIHSSGAVGSDPAALSDLAGVYRRGMDEVAKLLERVSTT